MSAKFFTTKEAVYRAATKDISLLDKIEEPKKPQALGTSVHKPYNGLTAVTCHGKSLYANNL